MARYGLKYLDKLIVIEEKERKEHKKKTRREAQLPVSVSKISAPTNTP
jgi:hypothetical protein